jgi:hypothetical protein
MAAEGQELKRRLKSREKERNRYQEKHFGETLVALALLEGEQRKDAQRYLLFCL